MCWEQKGTVLLLPCPSDDAVCWWHSMYDGEELLNWALSLCTLITPAHRWASSSCTLLFSKGELQLMLLGKEGNAGRAFECCLVCGNALYIVHLYSQSHWSCLCFTEIALPKELISSMNRRVILCSGTVSTYLPCKEPKRVVLSEDVRDCMAGAQAAMGQVLELHG